MPDRIIVSAPGPQGPAGTGGSGSISDGDKGDITVSGVGTVWTVDAGAINTSKLGGDITAAGKALLDDADAAAQRTTLGIGTAALEAAGYFATAAHSHIAGDIDTFPTDSLVGRADAGSGVCRDIRVGNGLEIDTQVDPPQLNATAQLSQYVQQTRSVSASTGLTGGGDLSSDRSFAVDFAASGVSSATQAVRADDSRLSDARTPTTHGHTAGEVSGLANVATSGDYTDLSNTPTVPSVLSDLSNVSSTAPASGEVLKWNGSAWAPGSDLTGPGGTGAPTAAEYFTLSADATLTAERVLTFGTGLTATDGGAGAQYDVEVEYGTTQGTACQGNDSRLSDARTPTAHTHDAADINAGTLAIARIPTGTSSTTVCVGDDARLSDARTPTAHTHDMVDSYVGHIVTPDTTTPYLIDIYAATARTITGIHIATGTGTVDYTWQRISGGLTAVIYTADGQGTTQSDITSGLANNTFSAGDKLQLTIDATSGGGRLDFTVVYSRTTGAIT